MKLKKRFYVAAEAIKDAQNMEVNWAKETLEEAIDHARFLIEKSGVNERYIVQVIRVVRRQRIPVDIEEVD